jgi:hypothetical protein
MPSSAMLRRVALKITDVSEEHSVSIVWVTRIGELRTELATDARCKILLFLRSIRRLLVTVNVVIISPILGTLIMELRSSETSVLT